MITGGGFFDLGAMVVVLRGDLGMSRLAGRNILKIIGFFVVRIVPPLSVADLQVSLRARGGPSLFLNKPWVKAKAVSSRNHRDLGTCPWNMRTFCTHQ